MDSFFEVVTNVLKESKFAVWTCIILFLIALFIFLCICLMSIYKIYQKISSDNKVLEIVSNNAKLNKEIITINSRNNFLEKQIKNLYERVNIVEFDIKRIFSKKLGNNDEGNWPKSEKEIYTGEIGRILSDYIDFLTHELSFNNRVRIILWGLEDNERIFVNKSAMESFREKDIVEIFRSSNYSSRSKEKKININKSIAGRAMRTKEAQIVKDVANDPDWSSGEKNQYISISAIPLEDNKILTIDYEKKPDSIEIYLAAISAKLLLLLLTLVKNNIQQIKLEKPISSFDFDKKFDFDKEFDFDIDLKQ